jgi:hypothetical protein
MTEEQIAEVLLMQAAARFIRECGARGDSDDHPFRGWRAGIDSWQLALDRAQEEAARTGLPYLDVLRAHTADFDHRTALVRRLPYRWRDQLLPPDAPAAPDES